MSYENYKILHVLSIFSFLMLITLSATSPRIRKRLSMFNGLLAVLILTGGMGLMARLGGGFQPWIIAKVILWALAIGAGEMMIRRVSNIYVSLGTVWGLCSLAALFAITKPF